MSALVMGLVWELPETQKFGRAEKFVLMAYADHADSNGKNIYPSISLVMKKTFYEERNAQKITRALEVLGYLIADGVGPHGTNRWAIPITRTFDGGAKIAPVQNAGAENAPEGNAPEGNAPKPSVVVLKESTTTTEAEIAEIFRMYESEIGLLTPIIRDALNERIDDEKIPNQWILDAMRRAVVMNARSWAYVDKILQNWKSKGMQDTRAKGAKNGDTRSTSKTGKDSYARRSSGKPGAGTGGENVDSEPADDPQAAERHREQWEKLRRKSKMPTMQ